MGKTLKIGGHRGMGCTDHEFYRSRRDVQALPAENTIASVEAAFAEGADYVEIDAVMSADGILFTLHNVVPADHFFGAALPPQLLNKMAFSDMQAFHTGHGQKGRVAPLDEMLASIARHSPKTLPWDVNIEIKGVQGSNQPLESNDYIKRLAEVARQSSLASQRILFSSFALHNVMAMTHELPQAQYGMLFSDKPAPRPIYADRQQSPSCQYLPYDSAHASIVQGLWREGAAKGATLGYFHPEFHSITPDTIMLADRHNVGINSWALFEEMTPARLAAYLRIEDICHTEDVPMTVITDYISAFRG